MHPGPSCNGAASIPKSRTASRALLARKAAALFLTCSLLSGGVSTSVAEEPIRVVAGTRELPEMGVFPEWVISTDASRVAVLPPRNGPSHPELSARKLKLQMQDYSGSIILEFTSKEPATAAPENESALLQLVSERYPGATIHSLGVVYAGTTRGVGFDVERVTTYKTKLTTQLVFLPLPDGVLEVSLNTASENFSTLKHTFITFLSYIQIKPLRPANG